MSNKKWTLLIILGVLLILSIAYINFSQKIQPQTTINTPALDSAGVNEVKVSVPRLSTVSANLEVPWVLVFLPDRSILFTERPGRIRIIDSTGNLNPNPVAAINDVLAQGEGGLLGIIISFMYITLTQTLTITRLTG